MAVAVAVAAVVVALDCSSCESAPSRRQVQVRCKLQGSKAKGARCKVPASKSINIINPDRAGFAPTPCSLAQRPVFDSASIP